MISCPNKRLKAWKDLVKIVGEDRSYLLWNKYKGDVPQSYYIENIDEPVTSVAGSDIKVEESIIFEDGSKLKELESNSALELFNDIKTDIKADKKAVYSEVYEELLFGNSQKNTFKASEVLTNIIKSSNLELINNWDFYFEKALNTLNKTGAKVKLISKSDFLNIKDADENSTMHYDPTTNTISISKEIIETFTPEVILSSFIHEVSHSTSVDAYVNPKTFEQQDFKKIIDEAFEQYRYLAERRKTKNLSYGFSNPLEFISEIYSNPDFRNEVKQIEGFWQKFINALRRLIGLPNSLQANSLVESAVLFNAVDNMVEIDKSSLESISNYSDSLFKKIDEDLFTDLSNSESRIDNTIDKFNESISKSIDHFQYLKNRSKDEKKAENIKEYLRSLYELRDEIKKNSQANKAKSVIAFAKYMADNIRSIENRLNSIDTSNLAALKNTVRVYDNYLSLFSIINDVITTVNELKQDEDQDFITTKQLDELIDSLSIQKGKYDILSDKMDLFKRKAFAKHINDIKYFPDIEKKNYNRLAKEHRDNNIPENKDIWIARQMNGRDKNIIDQEVMDKINQLLNNPSVDIYYSDVIFSSSINVSDSLVQIMNQMLQEVDNERISTERKKDLEFKKLFEALSAEKGSTNPTKLYENIIQYDKNGQPFLLNEYSPEFYTDVFSKIKEIRKEYEAKKEEQWIVVKEAEDAYGKTSKQYKAEAAKIKEITVKKEALIKEIEVENLELDKKGKFVKIKDKWLSPKVKLTSAEEKVLEFFKEITETGSKATYGKQNLIKYAYKAKFYELPKITKSNTERIWVDKGKGIFKDKLEDLTTMRPDDVGYDTRQIGVDNKPITSLRIHYRSNNFNHKNQSMDLMGVYRLEYKNTNTYKIRRKVELELNMLTDIVKNKPFYDKSGTRFRIKSSTNKINVRKGVDTNTFKMMNNMMESKFYDILKKGDIKVGSMDLNKMVAHLNGISSTLALAFNIASGTANVLNANAQLFLESFIKGHYIKAEGIAKANAIFAADLGSSTADLLKPINESFTNQLAEEFNVRGLLNLSDANFLQTDLLKKGLTTESMQAFQASGEHWVQSVITMAVLDGVKVMDANFNFIDKEGNVVAEDKAASLLDMYSKNSETGLLEVSDKVVYTSNSKTTKYNEGGKEKVDMLIYKKMYDSIGNYRQNDQPDLYRHWWGNLVGLYRKYLIPMGTARLRGIEYSTIRSEDLSEDQQRFSYALQEYEEGTYTSLIRYIATSLRDKKYYILSKSNWDNLSDYEKHNIKRSVAEIVTVSVMLPLATALIAGLAKAAGDDDDEMLYFMAYSLRRLDTELSQYMSIEENFKIMRSPIPSSRLLETAGDVFSKVFNPFNWDELQAEYQQGRFKGQNKVKIKLEKQIPLFKEFMKSYQDYYEYQNSSWGTGLQ
jgi:hypothetical protein